MYKQVNRHLIRQQHTSAETASSNSKHESSSSSHDGSAANNSSGPLYVRMSSLFLGVCFLAAISTSRTVRSHLTNHDSFAAAAAIHQKESMLRPRWLIINNENFQVVCLFDPVQLTALQAVNSSPESIDHKQKLSISLRLPLPSPIEFEFTALQQVVYQLDLESQPAAAWQRAAELLGLANMPWMEEADLRYLKGKGDSSPHTDTEIEVAEV